MSHRTTFRDDNYSKYINISLTQPRNWFCNICQHPSYPRVLGGVDELTSFLKVDAWRSSKSKTLVSLLTILNDLLISLHISWIGRHSQGLPRISLIVKHVHLTGTPEDLHFLLDKICFLLNGACYTGPGQGHAKAWYYNIQYCCTVFLMVVSCDPSKLRMSVMYVATKMLKLTYFSNHHGHYKCNFRIGSEQKPVPGSAFLQMVHSPKLLA